ncbi:MAG: hypothetical protein MUE72_12320 [Chitinophagaceae bacterium]|jgi:hypothetical protein|nr:hypothetical protein [Chitinophagaceae bacterium]
MKKTFLFLVYYCINSIGISQSLDTAVLSSYPSSVIVRVNDVATKVTLSTTEQIMLAEVFLEEETALKTAILAGAATTVIDSIKLHYKRELNMLLPQAKREAYYNQLAAAKSNTIARITAQVLRNKYQTDSLLEAHFNTIYGWRENLLENVWLSNVDTVIRNNNLYNIITLYDSVISRYAMAGAASNYFSGRVHYIDSLIALPENKKNTLAESFFANCMNYKYRSYADNFNTAFQTVFTTVADTPYYSVAYNNEVTQNSIAAAQSALSVYLKTYDLSVYAAEQIVPYLVQRERGIALANKLYTNYTEAKDNLVKSIVHIHQPVIDSLVGLYANLYSTSQIDIAIKFATELDLTNDQLSSLHTSLANLREMEAAYRLEDPFGEYDSKAYESETLSNILSQEQYTYVLEAQYYGKSAAMAKKDWQELIRLGLHLEFNETTVKTELTNYHLAVFIAYYRNAHTPDEQYASVVRINEVMPEVMMLLLKHWTPYGATPYGNLPDVFFQW